MTKVGKIPENSGLFLLEGFPNQLPWQAIHKAVTVGGVDDKRSDSEDLSEDENYNQVKKDS